jgi:hypothetical protein
MSSDFQFRSQIIEEDDFDTGSITSLFDGTPISQSLPAFRLMPNPDEDSLPLADLELLYGVGIPLLSERAVDLLADVLHSNGQLFPVESTAGAYYLFNVTTVLDALDREKSQIEYWPTLKRDADPPRVRQVDRYVFRSDRLEGATIFKLPEHRVTKLYATDVFAERVSKANLQGFSFHLIWPLEERLKVKRPAYQEKRNRKRVGK